MAQRDQIWSIIIHMGGQNRYNAIWSIYIGFLGHSRILNCFICSYNGFLEPPGGPQLSKKWFKSASPVIVGHLDHYVVFGTKSGAEEDFQRGKKLLLGVKQNPPDQR